LGMGLSISRSIIEAHGGRLWARTNVPKGALFQFTLAIANDQEPGAHVVDAGEAHAFRHS
jgi:signal transduction histidine kinase